MMRTRRPAIPSTWTRSSRRPGRVDRPSGATTPTSNFLNANDVARAGHVSGQTNRSFFQMSTGSTIHGKQIIKATLRTYETWSYSCTKRHGRGLVHQQHQQEHHLEQAAGVGQDPRPP